jgi:hypothetical protein
MISPVFTLSPKLKLTWGTIPFLSGIEGAIRTFVKKGFISKTFDVKYVSLKEVILL